MVFSIIRIPNQQWPIVINKEAPSKNNFKMSDRRDNGRKLTVFREFGRGAGRYSRNPDNSTNAIEHRRNYDPRTEKGGRVIAQSKTPNGPWVPLQGPIELIAPKCNTPHAVRL